MENPVLRHPHGFDFGVTAILKKDETPKINLDFSLIRLRSSEQIDVGGDLEYAVLLLVGEASVRYDQKLTRISRASVFDEGPIALHIAAKSSAVITAHSACELALVATDNEAQFSSEMFDQYSLLENEHRGQGLLDDTAYRIVRTIFDKRNRPQSNLVLGEVITFPGRWSSYPPHFHAQPEIYHYRFTEPQGYGHAELGDQVFKIREYDTLAILDNNTHAQVSAPGYGMYYLWAIRHLPGDPYSVPTFVDEHAWTKEEHANARVWKPA